jgi:hypothetical protein
LRKLLIFSTKAAGEKQKTVVTFLAKELREKLTPESAETDDAESWFRLSERKLRVDKWSVCRG